MALKTTPFNVLDHLKTPEEQIAYLEAALEIDDPSFIAAAIGDIAKARGVSEFSRETGLSREAIYKAFKQGGNPTLETLDKALKPLGMRLTLAARNAA
ncbi:putative addiction module antidote protein [Bradyrhizobium sp. BRP22]|uniref:addiction module antidote protein n=1 Tax=Bradyrhizobium sp. BRP22 TaxID=2793821 RepID=UPI001CD6FEC5|nr:addiction module antidote protein [Bradyrhizobium sp. BRP22]MCA1456817.1 putative addiction module antidote protein [Bradyrhizobium sp. BRP22]